MKDIDQLHPDRFPAQGKSAGEIIDEWFNDHFHGPHHARQLADPHGYVRAAADDLKRRFSEEKT